MSLMDLQKTFEHLDTDKDGHITIEEFEQGVRSLGIPPPARANTISSFHGMDSNRDGRIQWEEFCHFCSKRGQELQSLFDSIDEDKNGLVSSDEMALAIRLAGMTVSADQLRDIMHRIDQDRNGQVDFKEFCETLLWLPTINPKAVFEQITDASFIELAEGYQTLPKHLPPSTAESSKKKYSLAAEIGQQLYFGGIAGAVSRTCTAPIDRIKVVVQATAPGTRTMTLSQVLTNIYQEGGIRAFFRGNMVNCVKVAPETAIKFFAFDVCSRNISQDPRSVTVLERFIAGGLAGSITQMAVYPMEIVKTRINVAARGTYSSILDCIRKTVSAEGMGALYKGAPVSVAGIIPYAGIDLMTNSVLKEMGTKYYVSRGLEPSVAVVIVSGMLSSSLGMFITYPLNLIRTRLQASGIPGAPVYHGALDCFQKTMAMDGYRGLFKGMLPNMLKVVPASSISYTMYDVLRKLGT